MTGWRVILSRGVPGVVACIALAIFSTLYIGVDFGLAWWAVAAVTQFFAIWAALILCKGRWG